MAERKKTPTEPTASTGAPIGAPADAAADPLETQPVKNTADLDDISLAQALLDVDVANSRVIDLTKRLTALTKELRQSTTDLQKAKLRNRKIAAELDEIKGSRAYRSASAAQRMLGSARARLGR
jgi:predicted  nucleic acid-binding Zn-ribbon protein